MLKREYIDIGNTRVNVTVDFDSKSIIMTTEQIEYTELRISNGINSDTIKVNKNSLEQRIIEPYSVIDKDKINAIFK